jgi:hypothetical protein
MSDTNEPPDGGEEPPPPPPPPSGGYAPPPPPPQYGQPQQQWGQPYQQPPMGATEKVPNYLVQAILVTLFCCLPAGVVAIVFAAQVNGKLEAGDIAGARSASRNAKLWSWVSLGIGVAVILLYIFLIVVLGVFSAGTSSNFNSDF